jgi:hypothetical protein
MKHETRHERFLGDVAQEHCFHLKGGKVVKNLCELHDTLLEMDEDTFNHHVTRDRNDFKNWVEHVIKDHELAQQISQRHSRRAMVAAVYKRIEALEKEKQKKICEQREHINCGLREFLAGIALGILIGLIIARLLT